MLEHNKIYCGDCLEIMKEIEQADLLIFTTPNYCMAPSAAMKSSIDFTFNP